MKTLLLILEHHFYKDENDNVWCERIVDYDYLKRYLLTFDKVCVCARFIDSFCNTKNMKKANGKGITFFPLPEFKGISISPFLLFKINHLVKTYSSRTDCILVRSPSIFCYILWHTLIKSKNPIALEVVITADHMLENRTICHKAMNYVLDLLFKRMCMRANGVSYVTKSVLQSKYPCKAFQSQETPDYFSSYYSSIDLESSRFLKMDWSGFNPDRELRLVHVGYMDDLRKGQHIALQVTCLLIQKGYNASIYLIGDGNRRQYFETLSERLNISDKCYFEGNVNDEQEKFQILSSCHIFVMPTESEGLPRCILEAMSVGLPCIASEVDGNIELLDSEYLVKGRNAEKYVAKILKLIKNKDEIKRVSELNFYKANEYEKSKLDDRRKAFYDKLCNLACPNNPI